MTDASSAGMNGEKAKIAILSVVTPTGYAKSSNLANTLMISEKYPNNPIPKQMFFRALKSLIREGKLRKEKLQGREKVYYLPGKRPYIVEHRESSELDSLLIEVSKGIIARLIERPHLFDRELEQEVLAVADRYGLNIPVSEFSRVPEEEDIVDIGTKLYSAFNLVREWETRRGIEVPRPWDSTVPDFLLVAGPGTLEMLDILVSYPMEEAGDGDEGSMDHALAKDAGKLLASYEADVGELPDRDVRHTFGRYPFVREWFQFYLNVIEAVSDFMKAQKTAKKPKKAMPGRPNKP